MNKIIKTILLEWKERKLPDLIDRDIDLKHYFDIKPRKVITVTGFRRVGKTYLVFQLIQNLLKKYDKKEVIYINFEDERIPQKTKVLTELIPTIKQTLNKNPKALFLDEIQEIPNWSKWVRRIYDQKNIKIFLIGPSSKISSEEIPTELRGRCLEVKVFPLSFCEYLKFKNIKLDLKNIPYSDDQKAKLMNALEEYVIYGGMPEVVLTDKQNKEQLLQEYYKTVISRDIIQRFNIKNEEKLKAMLRLLVNSTLYSITKLYNTLKSLNYAVGKTTVLKYFSYIENSYFAESIPIFSYKIKSQLQYPKKVYFVDNGFITALSTKFSNDFGRLYENLIFQELKRKLNIQEEVFYWKNRTQEEVDFVIRRGTKVIKLIQVCYDLDDHETKEREIKALLKASKEFKCDNLIVINRDVEKTVNIKSKTIKYIPLWQWLLKE